MNQLVGFITLGIYTPMDIKVTCAEGGGMGSHDPQLQVPPDASPDQIRAAFAEAANLAVRSGNAVYVRLTATEPADSGA